MEDNSINMEDDLKMTVSIWKMTISIWEIAVSLWDMLLLCLLAEAARGGGMAGGAGQVGRVVHGEFTALEHRGVAAQVENESKN